VSPKNRGVLASAKESLQNGKETQGCKKENSQKEDQPTQESLKLSFAAKQESPPKGFFCRAKM